MIGYIGALLVFICLSIVSGSASADESWHISQPRDSEIGSLVKGPEVVGPVLNNLGSMLPGGGLLTLLNSVGNSKNVPAAGLYQLGNGLGIGIGIKKADTGSIHWLPANQSGVKVNFPDVSGMYGGQMIFLIEKIGPIKPGQYGPIDIGTFAYGTSEFDKTWDKFHKKYELIATYNANLLTCQIQTQKVKVNMGDISMSTFKKVGDKSAPVTFGVSMICPAGINKMFYQLSPAGGSTVLDKPNDGNISLSNKDGASGVGVHIENGDPSTPIPLGQNLQINQYNPNQDNQRIQTNFTASYIQIGRKVTGGEADAKATYTLTYQ